MNDFENTCFDTMTTPVRTSGNVEVHPLCFGFIFVNKGDLEVRVNNITLKPFPAGHPELSGESFAFVDPKRKLFSRRQFQVQFNGTPTANTVLEITQVHHVQK